MNTEFYEGEQSFCSLVDTVSTTVDCSPVSASVVCVVGENIDFYGEEQFCSPLDTDAICTVVVVVVDTDALTLTADLTAGLVNTTKNSAWMSHLGPIEYLAPKPKHKRLPKVKIKDY